MKWPWEEKYVFHEHGIPEHGIPEDMGAMNYINLSQSTTDLEEGKNIAITKPVSLIDWQDPYKNVAEYHSGN
ncbi:MAG: hypothetical protein L0H55_11115 [Candidatus Nitrosocosmicus sp.]|nr:hypothetical protein [Candidatus Nitrosocosmicus sp.]